MLISHILLAFATLPLVILTLVPVFRRALGPAPAHRSLDMPIWLTFRSPCAVYLMLYKWFPRRILR